MVELAFVEASELALQLGRGLGEQLGARAVHEEEVTNARVRTILLPEHIGNHAPSSIITPSNQFKEGCRSADADGIGVQVQQQVSRERRELSVGHAA